jgi:hypothetical protein
MRVDSVPIAELIPSPNAPPIQDAEVLEIDAREKESETMQLETPTTPPTCPEVVEMEPMLNDRLIVA